MWKQFETEDVQGLEKIIADFTYEEAKISGGLKKSLLESILDAQWEIANCVAMLSNGMVSVREATSFKPSASVASTSAAHAGTAPLT